MIYQRFELVARWCQNLGNLCKITHTKNVPYIFDYILILKNSQMNLSV